MAEKRQRIGGSFLSLPCSFWGLAAADLCAVGLAIVFGYCLRAFFPGSLSLESYLSLLPAVLLFPALFAAMGLYPGDLLHAAEELKILSRATTIGFALVAASFFLFKSADEFSRAFFIGSWLFALLLVPVSRHLIRCYCSRFTWWQTPVIFFGGQQAVSELCFQIDKVKSLGLTPVAFVFPEQGHEQKDSSCDPEKGNKGTLLSSRTAAKCADQGQVRSVDLEGCFPPTSEQHTLRQEDEAATENLFRDLAERYPGSVVTVLLATIPEQRQESLLRIAGDHFHRLILLPCMDWLYCIPDETAHLCGHFALTVRRNLCDKRRLRLKRAFDLLACGIFALLTLPLFLTLMVLIRLDTPGPAIFRQTRIGRGGKPFQVFKFRTMQADAEAALKTYLAAHPEEALEWTETQKLSHDPRITKIGRFLRRTSLDELPQLINVLRGEMSFVGPRPIVEDEIARYDEVFPLYCRVLPGITGLWQISGRSDVTYGERVSLDRYYITNWSVWLDWYILARTVPVVLGMRGAY